jgi:hypothetical protein
MLALEPVDQRLTSHGILRGAEESDSQDILSAPGDVGAGEPRPRDHGADDPQSDRAEQGSASEINHDVLSCFS